MGVRGKLGLVMLGVVVSMLALRSFADPVKPGVVSEPAQPGPAPRAPSPFTKAYVGVYTKTQTGTQIVLKDPVIKELGNRSFIVGTPVAYRVIAVVGLPLRPILVVDRDVNRWLPVDEIVSFYEFQDMTGYRPNG